MGSQIHYDLVVFILYVCIPLLRAVRMTNAPRACNAIARALPKPWLAPVTHTCGDIRWPTKISECIYHLISQTTSIKR